MDPEKGELHCWPSTRLARMVSLSSPPKQSFLNRHTPSRRSLVPLSGCSLSFHSPPEQQNSFGELEIQTLRRKFKNFHWPAILNSFWSLLINKASILNNGSGCQGDQHLIADVRMRLSNENTPTIRMLEHERANTKRTRAKDHH